MFCIFNQISYDLTGSLTRNKDSLPQNLLFTLKCKWPMNNRPTVASPHTSRNPLGPTARKKSTPRVIMFCASECFDTYRADSAVCVYIVYRRHQMWCVVVGETQAAVVWLPGSQPHIHNCCNSHDEANHAKASPSLTLGCRAAV